MLSVAILNSHEPNVIKLTYQNLFRELKDIPDSELLIVDHWFDAISQAKNKYICFVEPDCLVNSGYFASQIGLFKKNKYFRKLAMLSSAVAVTNWSNKFYGYSVGNNYADGILPNKDKKSTQVYPVQIGYVPGAVIQVDMLKNAISELKMSNTNPTNLIEFSTLISLAFWKQGDGNRVHINPNTTYVTTEEYVNDIGKFDADAKDLLTVFKRETIS